MGVRSVRFHDLFAVRHLEAHPDSYVIWPSPLEAQHSATYLALASAWQDVNQTLFTFVLREKRQMIGMAQAAAQSGHDAWEVLRLSLVPADPEDRERAADALFEQLLAAIGGRGGMRVFAGVTDGEEGQILLHRQGFRRYTTQYSLLCERLDIPPTPLPEHLGLRLRRPADAWGIFQLYCSLAPPSVRHAEGLSSKRWNRGTSLFHSLTRHWLPGHEVVLTDEGLIVGWVRLTQIKGHAAQRLEVMLHPRVNDTLPALLAHAMVALNARLDRHTVCYVREYEATVYSGLQEMGFTVVAEQALLVKHMATRVTERQLLIAALRAQGLGIDVSRYQQPGTGVSTLANLTTVELPLHDRTRTN